MHFYQWPCRVGAGLRRPNLAAVVLLSVSAATFAQTVDVQTFEILGNTLLDPGAIQARLENFRGPATPQRLKEAAAAVQDLYRKAGLGGVVAFLPEQPLGEGRVRIRVVEGKLTRIDISDNRQFSTANILASLPALATGRTPDVRLIDAQIQMANESPAKNLQVLLQPGADAGSIAAKVNVAEQPVLRFSARLDNTGGANASRWRAALGWQHANVFDADQVVAAEYQTAPANPSTVSVFSGSWRMPLYSRSLAFDAYGAWSNVEAGKVGTAAGDLQFSGKGHVAGLRASAYLPRWFNFDQRLVLGQEWREYLNNCAIDGLPAGACGSAGESVGVQPVSLTYTGQAVGESRFGVSLGLHHNLGFGGSHSAQSDFDAVRNGSRKGYTLLRANAQASTQFEGSGLAMVRFNGQYSHDTLVPGELFGIGGAQSVRGFEERELGGDIGAQLTAEYQTPPVPAAWFGAADAKPSTVDLRAVMFADAGWVKNHQGDPCLGGRNECRMGGLGIGARLQWQQLQMRLDLARAMTTGSTTAKGDIRAHFGLNANF